MTHHSLATGRRAFVAGCLALGVLAVASIVDAQTTTPTFRIGFISSSTTSVSSPFLEAFRQALSGFGYVEGRNLAIEYRMAQKSDDELPAMARELVALKVNLIVGGGSQGILAAKNATSTIPIVMTNSGDAVSEGFVQSLVRPGGNITGLTQISPEVAPKRLDLLRRAVPGMARVAILWYPLHPNTPATFKETQRAAEQLGLSVVSLVVKDPAEIKSAFTLAGREHADGLVVLRDPFTVRNRKLIADSAASQRLPTIYETVDYLEAGGFLAYGPSLVELYRQAAWYVDKILRGARPDELPVQRPERFQFVINVAAARAIGLTIPPDLLLQADKLIE
jgi:putative ABC transport system substrate-binding protein